MAGDKGNLANPMVAFRDLVRSEAAKVSKANDQVILGVICAVKDGIDIECQIDGFGSGPIDALWCIPGTQPELGMRVVMNALTGGDKWFVIAIASAGIGASGKKIYYTNTGVDTFSKLDFPGLRAIFIRLVGSGGGGAGCTTTTSTQAAGGGGGGGGGYSEGYVLASQLEDVEDVKVGLGGTGGAAGTNNGGNGNLSQFLKGPGFGASWVGANGGGGGFAQAPTSNVPKYGGSGGGGGSNFAGDLGQQGGGGEAAILFETQVLTTSMGGGSHLSSPTRQHFATFGGGNGHVGHLAGGGGGGGQNADDQTTERTGGAGAPGIIIVELFF